MRGIVKADNTVVRKTAEDASSVSSPYCDAIITTKEPDGSAVESIIMIRTISLMGNGLIRRLTNIGNRSSLMNEKK